jgi:hypothetical protein
VSCLNTDHWQACFGENAVKPLRQRPSFQSNSLEAVEGQNLQESFRLTFVLQKPNTGKFDYFGLPNRSAYSMAFEFFTDDVERTNCALREGAQRLPDLNLGQPNGALKPMLMTRQKIIDLNQKKELKSAEREPKGSCTSVG